MIFLDSALINSINRSSFELRRCRESAIKHSNLIMLQHKLPQNTQSSPLSYNFVMQLNKFRA